MLKITIFLVLGLSFMGTSFAEDNPYDLLNSLDGSSEAPASVEDRMPASVEPGQISVRKKLPESKRLKTSFSLQREMLRQGAYSSEEEEPDDHAE